MDFRDLQYVIAVADCGSITEAAKKALYLSAVSQLYYFKDRTGYRCTTVLPEKLSPDSHLRRRKICRYCPDNSASQ